MITVGITTEPPHTAPPPLLYAFIVSHMRVHWSYFERGVLPATGHVRTVSETLLVLPSLPPACTPKEPLYPFHHTTTSTKFRLVCYRTIHSRRIHPASMLSHVKKKISFSHFLRNVVQTPSLDPPPMGCSLNVSIQRESCRLVCLGINALSSS